MLEITKGYKVGRAVTYYDLLDRYGNTTQERVHKDDIVKMAEAGQIKNTKIQWWEGKPIVRCTDSFVVVKMEANGEVVGHVEKAKRTVESVKVEEAIIDVSSKAKVVGKLTKKKKDSIAFCGYDRQYEVEQCQLQSEINYSKIETVGDLFMQIANEYKLRDKEVYLEQFAKKVNPSKKLSGMARNMIVSMQDNINTYLMNMAYKEIQETWMKYRVR